MANIDSVSVCAERPDTEIAELLLGRYLDEMGERGFDVTETVPVPSSELTAPQGRFMVVRIGDHAVGCGAIRMVDSATAEIKRMWIDAGYRGRGLGRRLLAALENECNALGARAVLLDSSEYLPEALGLYRASGYTEISPYNDNPDASHWFEKRVGEPQ